MVAPHLGGRHGECIVGRSSAQLCLAGQRQGEEILPGLDPSAVELLSVEGGPLHSLDELAHHTEIGGRSRPGRAGPGQRCSCRSSTALHRSLQAGGDLFVRGHRQAVVARARDDPQHVVLELERAGSPMVDDHRRQVRSRGTVVLEATFEQGVVEGVPRRLCHEQALARQALVERPCRRETRAPRRW